MRAKLNSHRIWIPWEISLVKRALCRHRLFHSPLAQPYQLPASCRPKMPGSTLKLQYPFEWIFKVFSIQKGQNTWTPFIDRYLVNGSIFLLWNIQMCHYFDSTKKISDLGGGGSLFYSLVSQWVRFFFYNFGIRIGHVSPCIMQWGAKAIPIYL